jgi:hypothetical protein
MQGEIPKLKPQKMTKNCPIFKNLLPRTKKSAEKVHQNSKFVKKHRKTRSQKHGNFKKTQKTQNFDFCLIPDSKKLH